MITPSGERPIDARLVRHFRQILLWPLHLMPTHDRRPDPRRWKSLCGPGSPWTLVDDEFPSDPAHFNIRHYCEFVTFLPSAQRFLYGERGRGDYGETPIRVFRRNDLRRVRLTFKDHFSPVELDIAHIDLYFFYDTDVVILTVEVSTDNLPLAVAQELLFRFGRAFPAGWDANGRGDHCLNRAEWLDAEGQTIVTSDYENREHYLKSVCQDRAAAISADWGHLLMPMVPDASKQDGELRYRLLEYYRMPVMAYLAVEDPRSLSRADFVRLALATRSGPSERAPLSESFLKDFEAQYCDDRYWDVDDSRIANTRFLCSGAVFVMVGQANLPFFTDAEQGMLGQFRHQYFLLGLIAHFHKAALLMFGDRLASAVNRLDIRDAENVKRFKRTIRQVFAMFLRFTHRYWFQEVSIQAQAMAVFALYRRHHGTDALYDGVRLEVQDMAQYLENDGLRRQANTVVRLTVVTTFGLIGSVATGLLGMNLIAAADATLGVQLLYFALAFLPTAAVTLYTVIISKSLSDMLEVLSDQTVPLKAKLALFVRAWLGSKSED